MKKYMNICIALFAPVALMFAQQELIGGQSVGGNRVNLLLDVTPEVYNESVEGSPYIYEKFLPATITASEDNIFYVRYNAVSDEFEVKAKTKSYALNRYRRDIQITILPLEKTYQVFGFLDENGNENFGYFHYLTDINAEVGLFKKEKIVFLEEIKSKTSYDSGRPAKFKRMKDLYFVSQKGTKLLIELPTKKKSIAKLFPDLEGEILNYIKEEKIKISKEKDLIKLLTFIDSKS